MKRIAIVGAAMLLSISQAALAQVWQKSTETYTAEGNSKSPVAVFVNSYTGTGPVSGVWHEIDLKPLGVAADAKSALLSGLLLITHGTTQETCDMHVALRAPGNGLDAGNYLGQVVEAHVGGGQRSGFTSRVPLVNGVFQFHWTRVNSVQWPAGCAYGINLSLQEWNR